MEVGAGGEHNELDLYLIYYDSFLMFITLELNRLDQIKVPSLCKKSR